MRSGADSSFQAVLGAVVELLPPPPLHVLDVGCGEGPIGRELMGSGYDVVGVDADPTMAGLAGEDSEALVADARSLPFASQTFDAVITVHVLMEIDESETALSEMAGVVRSGGVLVAVIEHPFSFGRRVARYSEASHYAWDVVPDGVNVGLVAFTERWRSTRRRWKESAYI